MLFRSIDKEVLIRKRGAKDIWENLYEFVLYENEALFMPDESAFLAVFRQWAGDIPVMVKSISPEFRQQLTHQTIAGRFIELTVNSLPPALKEYERVKWTAIDEYPFPRFINTYLQTRANGG